MTVGELRKELEKIPDDKEVVIWNTDLYKTSYYHSNYVSNLDEEAVEIVADYSRRFV